MTDSKNTDWRHPTPKQVETMSMSTPLVQATESDVFISNPPGERETRAELRDVIRSVRNSERERNIIRVSDENPLEIFKAFVENNDLVFDDDYFHELESQLKPLILKLKFKFARPRPNQVLGREIGSDIENSSTTKSPSYPSGHTIQAHTVANQLSKLYPQYSHDFRRIADIISHSRISGGSHFRSDIDAGIQVANQIDSKIITPYEHNGILGETTMRSMTREFLLEAAQEEPPEKLRVLDFDDTIAHTTERVRVETPDRVEGYKLISSEEFAVYDLQPGEYFDPAIAFREFDQVDVDRATPVPFVSSLFKTFVEAPGSRDVLILTARGPEVEPYVMKFIEKKLGISNPSEKVKFIGVASKDPMAKVREIENHVNNNPTIRFVSFYDDSGKNVKAVSEFLSSAGIAGDVRQVVQDQETGEISLINPTDDLAESLDYRSITRSFLSRFL